jgi:protein BUR2
VKELVTACVRVALKDPNKLVDEQTKDFWKWRDTILLNEDLVLESLCFDLNLESPYKTMYDMLKYFRLEHDKRVRNAAWAFLTDSCLTHLCLLFTSRTIAAASLYAGARMAGVELPSIDGWTWWEAQHVKLRDVRQACNVMADIYEQPAAQNGQPSVYTGLKTPDINFDTPQNVENGEVGASQPEAQNTDASGDVVMANEGAPVEANQNGDHNGAGETAAVEDGSEEGELSG